MSYLDEHRDEIFKKYPKEVLIKDIESYKSGMSFVSVLNGLTYYNKENIEVVGISVGKDVTKTLQKYLNTKNKYTIIKSELNYEQYAKEYTVGNVELDKIYEAKCIPFLKEGDLLWIVGKRKE